MFLMSSNCVVKVHYAFGPLGSLAALGESSVRRAVTKADELANVLQVCLNSTLEQSRPA